MTTSSTKTMSTLRGLATWHTMQTVFLSAFRTVLAECEDDGQSWSLTKPSCIKSKLKRSEEITFDPLGVVAIMHNPRAERSVARLYSTVGHLKHQYRWPHTALIGATLIPLKALVEHLSAGLSAVHPAVQLTMKDVTTIQIRSTMVFTELQFSFSNVWLSDVLAFKPSRNPPNDIAIVLLEDCDLPQPQDPPISHCWTRKLLIDILGLMNGALLALGTVSMALSHEWWSLVLFFFYLSHWVASTAISFATLIVHETPNIKNSGKATQYAVYERPEGGIVVVKAPGLVFEKFARARLRFNGYNAQEDTPTTPAGLRMRRQQKLNDFLHWFWMVTGTLAAISSVVCMVNMSAIPQLGFIVVVSYSSVAEIAITQLARSVQRKVMAAHGQDPTSRIEMILNRKKRTTSMIYSILGVDRKFCLEKIGWVDLKLLPESFRPLQTLLEYLCELKHDETNLEKGVKDLKFEAALVTFQEEFKMTNPELREQILNDVRHAWSTVPINA